MSNSTKLLDHLIKVKNLSGAIKPSPHVMKNLKGAINGVPFQLLQPSMSGVLDLQKIMKGVTQFSQMLGSLSAIGNLTQLLGRFKNQGNINQVSQLNSNQLASKINLNEIIAAIGDNNALGAGLNQYITEEHQTALDDVSGVNVDWGGTEIV